MYLDIPAIVAVLIALTVSIFTMIVAVGQMMYMEKQYYKTKTELKIANTRLKDAYR